MSVIKFYSKRDCLACSLVRTRLQQWQLKYEEIFDHKFAAPTIVYQGETLRPPISTIVLKRFVKKHKLVSFF